MNSVLGIRHMQWAIVLTVLSGVLLFGAGCATHQRYFDPAIDRTGVERPAQGLDEEETLADRIGEVGIVVLVVVVTLGGILLPILLL